MTKNKHRQIIKATQQFDWFTAGVSLVTLFFLVITTVAACDQVKASQAQLKLSQETAEAQLRAYVSIDTNIRVPIENNKITLTLKNGGQTPAYKVRGISAHHYFGLNDRLAENFAFEYIPGPSGQVISQSTLNAGASASITMPINVEVLNDAMEGKHNLIIYGEIQYEDIFRKFHTSEFAFQYDRSDRERGSAVMQILNVHNNSN